MVRLKGAEDYSMFFGATPKILNRARMLRKEPTEAEKILWSRIRNKQILGFKFRRQHPINFFIADFYCHEANLVLEIDGGIHDETEVKERDAWREEVINQFGIKVIRFKNDDIVKNIDKIVAEIESLLKT